MAKLGAAAVLGAMAAATSAATLVRPLDRVLPRIASALAATSDRASQGIRSIASRSGGCGVPEVGLGV